MLHSLRQSAIELTADQRALVPVDEGDLRASIGWSEGGVLTADERKKAGPRLRPGDIGVLVFVGGNKAYYAHMIEFGTVKMTARPFFFPPYRALRRRIRNRARRAARAAARAAVQKG